MVTRIPGWKSISVNIWIACGYLNDWDYGGNRLHLLEHTILSTHSIRSGDRYGAIVNGKIDSDHMLLYGRVPEEFWAQYTCELLQAARDPIDPSVFERELRLIQNELSLRHNRPVGDLHLDIVKRLLGLPIAETQPVKEETLNSLKTEVWTGRNLALHIVGDVEQKDVDLVIKELSNVSLSSGSCNHGTTYECRAEPVISMRRLKSGNLSIAAFPIGKYCIERLVAGQIAVTLLERLTGSPLKVSFSNEKGLYYVSADAVLRNSYGYLFIQTMSDIADSANHLQTWMRDSLENTLHERESLLEPARQRVRNLFMSYYQSCERVADLLGRHFLYVNDALKLDFILKSITVITPEQILFLMKGIPNEGGTNGCLQ